MSWTEEKVEKLKELWGKGNTASQIAEIIGGISRNAVIGKAHRLNLSAKIKARSSPNNQNFQKPNSEKNYIQKRGRRSRFKSLLIEKDFEPTYEISEDKTKTVNSLKKLAKESNEVWIATDEDRE